MNWGIIRSKKIIDLDAAEPDGFMPKLARMNI